MFEGFKKLIGLSPKAAAGANGRVQARFDAALTDAAALRRWENADQLNADAAASPEVRRTLRMRGRYEQFNNPYTDGMLQTLANDIVGYGPTPQFHTGVETLDSYLQTEFVKWMRATKIAKKLRCAVETTAGSGEVFLIRSSNPKLKTAVKLDLRDYEPDQIATPNPWEWNTDPKRTDGIVYDTLGNPLEYHVLDQHPGDTRFFSGVMAKYHTVPAEDVIHLFKYRRPGQRRGWPQIASSLPLFAERRGFRKSILSAARKVAELGAIVLSTETVGDESTPPDPMSTLDIEAGTMTVAPDGYTANQMKPEQPGTTFKEFDDKLINESGRPLNMPFCVAAGDSSSYNYASGRLDYAVYDRANEVSQDDIELDALDTALSWWVEEALMIPGYLPFRAQFLLKNDIPHVWLWRGRDQADTVKEADTDRINLESGVDTLTGILGRKGVDADSHLKIKAAEKKKLETLGLSGAKPIGAQELTAALNILIALSKGTITEEAAVQLLTASGMSDASARAAVKDAPKTPATTPVQQPAKVGNNGTIPVNGNARLIGIIGGQNHE